MTKNNPEDRRVRLVSKKWIMMRDVEPDDKENPRYFFWTNATHDRWTRLIETLNWDASDIHCYPTHDPHVWCFHFPLRGGLVYEQER